MKMSGRYGRIPLCQWRSPDATELWSRAQKDQSPLLEVDSGDYYVRIHEAGDWSGLDKAFPPV